MSIFTFMRSGVYIQNDDRTGRASLFNSTPGGIVFEAAQGSVDDLPSLTTSEDEWLRNYGYPDAKISPAHDCAIAFHKESSILFNKRVINGALWGGTTLYVDRNSKSAALGNRVRSIAFPGGMATGYKGGARDFDLLSFAGDLITGNTVTLVITNGVTNTTVGPITFATNHQSTMNALAAAITTALGTYGSGGLATVIPELSGNSYTIAVWAPLDATVSYQNPVIASGTTQTTGTIDGQARLMEVFADNPGVWSKDYGYKLTKVDPGVAQRFRLVFSGAVATGQTFNAYVNGIALDPVAWTTDSDTTMAAIATALRASPYIRSATVESIPGAINNDRVIVVIAEDVGPTALALTNVFISGSGSPAAVTVTEILAGQPSTGEMVLEVYSRENVREPKESFKISLKRQTNSRGVQTSVDNVVNLASGRSAKIKIVIPDYAREYVLKPELVDNVWVIEGNTIKWLSGGDDGAACTNGQIATAWDSFLKRDKIAARLLINGGYTSPIVQQKMIEIAERRFDAMAILDIPSDKTATMDALNYRKLEMNVNSSYGALYSPWLIIADERTDEIRDIPPSGHVAGVYAYSERTSTIYHAPAGLVRGLVKNLQGLTEDYDDGDRELLEPEGVNPIVDFPGVGPAVFGEETLQYNKSILSSVHARRLLNLIQVTYSDSLKFDNFDPNNEQLWFRARQRGEKLLKPFKDGGGLVGYEIVCDARNNNAAVRDQDGMQVWVYLKITTAAKRILLKTILLPTGAKFSEEIAFDVAA